jgi:hypothetical protein
MTTKATAKALKTTTSPGKIPVTTSFALVIYDRLDKYTKEKGLDRVQDTVRIALAKFLDSEGF